MIRSLFARKPIEALLAEGENPNGLRRVLGSGDLIMLAIGAVIGAGIFGKTEEDSLEDFKNVYDFKEAFVKPFAPAKSIAPAVAGPPGLHAPKLL